MDSGVMKPDVTDAATSAHKIHSAALHAERCLDEVADHLANRNPTPFHLIRRALDSITEAQGRAEALKKVLARMLIDQAHQELWKGRLVKGESE